MNLRYAKWIETPVLDDGAEFEPLPDDIQQWTVDFDVVSDGWVVGSDRGLVWVDEQNFYVVARHTSFAIPGHRLKRGLVVKTDFMKPYERHFSLGIETGTPLSLVLQFDLPADGRNGPKLVPLRDAVVACLTSSNPEIEGQLPPRTPFVNAQSVESLRNSLMHMFLVLMTCILVFCLLSVGVLEELRIAPVWVVLLFLGMAHQVCTWFFPKAILIRKAMFGRRRFYAQAKDRSTSG